MQLMFGVASRCEVISENLDLRLLPLKILNFMKNFMFFMYFCRILC